MSSFRINPPAKVIRFPVMPRIAAIRLAERLMEAAAVNDAADQATFTDVRKFLPGIRAANEVELA